VPKSDREKFEQDYRNWIRLMSRDAAYRLFALPSHGQENLLKAYENFKEPLAIFRKLSDEKRVKRLAGERISRFIVIETDAVTFFPSIYSSIPRVLDYAVAMNRRLFYKGLWFPIISLNSEYIQRSSDRLLTFALEHEFEMSRIYENISLNLKVLTSVEKSDITDSAKEISQKRMTITKEELIEDEHLMLQLSRTKPLLPKPYAERAMLLFLEANLPSLMPFGIKSSSPDEESFGEGLFFEFQSWSDFSQITYELFVREILSNLRDANQGYG
jgi:hypothetical protein